MSGLEEFLEPPPVGSAVEVTVEEMTGRGTWGPDYAAPVPVYAWIDQSATLVRTLEGEEIVSGAGLFVTVGRAQPLVLGARVTLPGEDAARTVVTRSDRVHGAALGLPVHVEVRLS